MINVNDLNQLIINEKVWETVSKKENYISNIRRANLHSDNVNDY
jgi:hypothetical protein